MNPVSRVPPRKVPQRIYETLSFDEVRLVIEAAGSTWRNLIATAIYLALRKGELFALRKQDIDLEDGCCTSAARTVATPSRAGTHWCCPSRRR